MGTATLGQLVVQLAADTVKFQGDLGKAAEVAEDQMNHIKQSGEKALGALSVLAAAAGGALIEAFKSGLENTTQIQKLSEQVGLTTEEFSRLQLAARLTDVSTDSLENGLKHLSQTMALASAGNTEAINKFEALGVSMKLVNSGNVLAVFTALAERFSQFKDSATKTADAIDVMGRAGNELLPVLNLGKDGLENASEASDRLGNTLSGKVAEAAVEFKKKLTELEVVKESFTEHLMQAMLPGMDMLVNRLLDAATDADKMNAAVSTSVDFFKTLVSELVVVVNGFIALGKISGASWAASVQALQGNFSESVDIVKDAFNDLKGASTDTAKTVKDVWSDSSGLGMFSSITDAIERIKKDMKTMLDAPVVPLQTIAELAQQVFTQIGSSADTELAKQSAKFTNTIVKGVDFNSIETATFHMWDVIDEISQEGAKGIQSDFENFFFDPVKVGFGGLLTSFIDTVRRMVAQAAAADLMHALFGTTKSGESGLGGFFGALLNGLIGSKGGGSGSGMIPISSPDFDMPVIDFGGGLASGGPLQAGKWYTAGEHGPEPIWGGGPGAFATGYGGGGGGMNVTYNIDARGATTDLVRALPTILKQNNDALESKIVTGIKRNKY